MEREYQQEVQIDVNSLNESQQAVWKRFSTMVREVLTIVEAAVPPESRQYKAIKKMLNEKMYNARNDLTDFFKD